MLTKGHAKVLVVGLGCSNEHRYILINTFNRVIYMRYKKIFITAIEIIFVISLINMMLYTYKQIKCTDDIILNSEESHINKRYNSDYILLCEKNNWTDFPFIFGGKILLYSAETGDKYFVADTKKPFKTLTYPFATKGAVYYSEREETGGAMGALHRKDLQSGKDEVIFEQSYYDFCVSKYGIAYISDKDIPTAYYSDKTGKETRLSSNFAIFVGIEEDTVYCYDSDQEGKGVLRVFQISDEVTLCREIAVDEEKYGYICQIGKRIKQYSCCLKMAQYWHLKKIIK